nr:hypothetical protein [Angustibacter aerolatus]
MCRPTRRRTRVRRCGWSAAWAPPGAAASTASSSRCRASRRARWSRRPSAASGRRARRSTRRTCGPATAPPAPGSSGSRTSTPRSHPPPAPPPASPCRPAPSRCGCPHRSPPSLRVRPGDRVRVGATRYGKVVGERTVVVSGVYAVGRDGRLPADGPGTPSAQGWSQRREPAAHRHGVRDDARVAARGRRRDARPAGQGRRRRACSTCARAGSTRPSRR